MTTTVEKEDCQEKEVGISTCGASVNNLRIFFLISEITDIDWHLSHLSATAIWID